MEFSGASVTEMQEILLAMQKNLECPICLEVMKEPVSTKCAHIFCRFCVFKLLSQKKGVTQCPLCNAKVTKRSLWEDVRFKQVIEGVLQTICAFEHDTGIKFADDQCFPKRAIETISSSVPQKNKSIVDSKGYRNRLKNIKERKKKNTTREKTLFQVNMMTCSFLASPCAFKFRTQFLVDHETDKLIDDKDVFIPESVNMPQSTVKNRPRGLQNYQNLINVKLSRSVRKHQGENSSLPSANGPRYSLRKKRNCKKTIVFEIGSDSSEDLIKKAGAVECVDFGSGSLSRDSDGNAKKQSSSLCHMKLSEPTTEDAASLDILGACDLLEEGLGSTEVNPVNTGNSEVVEENVAVEKCQQLSFQDPCTQHHDNKSNSSPKQEDYSCSLLTREQLVGEATKPTIAAGHGAEKVDVLPAGSAQICSIPPENNEQLLQPQAPPDSPLSQVSGKRLRQSIQKVNEWLSKSKGIPSPKPLQDAQTEKAQTEELIQDLDSYLLEADSRISQKTEQMKDLGEFIMECESDRRLSKTVASKIEDKIFGRTYRRERRSTSLLNEKETNQIPAEEGIAINTKSHDTPVRKILMRKRKAVSMLTPEDFIKRQDIKVSSKRPDGVEDRSLEEGGHNSSVNRNSVADPKKAMSPAESVKEGVSTLKTEAGKQTRSKSLPESNLCDSKNKKKTNSLSKRRRCTLNWVEAKEPEASVHLQCSAELQIDSYPSSEEPRYVVAGQMQVRRSKRLQLWTEEACRRNEPAKRKREQVDEKNKGGKQRGSQEVKILHFPSTAEDDPVLLQGRLQKDMSCSDANLMGMKDAQASKACSNLAIPSDTLEVVESSLSSEQMIKGCSPCYTVPNMNSQGICSLPQFHPKAEQSTFEGKQFTEIPQSKVSGLSPKVPESDGFCIGDVIESCKIPKAGNKAAGTLELNPETDDSELDTAFVQKIFSRCTRQSFLLHPSPIKESVAEIQKMSVEGKEEQTIGCMMKSTQGIDRISEQREEAVACEVTKNICVQSLNLGPGSCTSSFSEQNNGMEHLQVVSKILCPNYASTPGSATKNAQDESQLQSQKLGSLKGTSEELRGETSKTNSGSKSLSVLCKSNLQDIHLNFLNETNANTVHFQETGPEGAEKKILPLSSQPELMHLHPESCQLLPSERNCIHNEKQNNTMVQSPDSCSPGVPKCLASGENVEQSFDEELHNFPQLLETPKSLHGSAVKGNKCSSNLWGTGRKDILAAFAKTAEQTFCGRDLDSSNSSKSSKCEELVRSHRRLVQRLPSSEEEDSSEDEELPCFQALISGQLVNTPSHVSKKETLAPSSNSRNIHKSEDEAISPSQQSQCSVNLFSSQSHESEDNSSKWCDSKFIIPASTSKDKLASPNRKENTTQPRSRMSGDGGQLKDGHQEHAELNTELNLGEETMDYDSEASHLEDSSGLSSQSETLTTQQKEFMQNNLKKLQQKMAILEAVLKEESQSTAPKELLPTCNKTDFVGGQTIPASGVELVMKAKSGNVETTNLKEDLLEEVPATPDNPASNKNLEPVVQQLQSAGRTSKLRSGSKQNLGAFSPAESVQGTPNSSSVSSSRSEGHTSICLATGTARKSPDATQVTDRSTVAMHKTHGEPSSSLAPIACCSAGNGKLKSSHLTCKNMSLVASGLNQSELRLVQKFAKKTGSMWSNQLTEETTHVVMKTDEDLVCERTLKYFLGIAARKWVVSYHWIVQSLKEGKVINEVDFEVKGDVVNGRSHEGPKRARESLAGKIFQGLEICCYGPFTDMPSEQLEWMVELCGASLVKQPHLFAHASKSAAVVVVQPDAWVDVAACQEILLQCGATVVAREWVLDSVACYECQKFDNYIVIV